jgi:hypothetical protein
MPSRGAIVRRINSTSTGLAAAVFALTCASAAVPGFAADSTDTENGVVASIWQHHKVTFPYLGLTSKYNCNSLADTVRGILVHLGARNDALVWASGCGPGSSVPGSRAFIATDFYTLAPAADSDSSGTVPAHWTAKHLDPKHPYFMNDGSCELIDQMKDLITQNFAIQDLKYRTDCFPHEINRDGFSVKGMALTAVAAKS